MTMKPLINPVSETEVNAVREEILQSVCNAYNIPRDLLETAPIIKCAECGSIIDLSEDYIKRYCIHQKIAIGIACVFPVLRNVDKHRKRLM